MVQNLTLGRLTPVPAKWKVFKNRRDAITTQEVIARIKNDVIDHIKNTPKFKGTLISECDVNHSKNKKELKAQMQEQ